MKTSLTVLSILLVSACGRQPEPPPPEPTPHANSSADVPPAALLLPRAAPPSGTDDHAPQLKWTDPPGWTRAPSSSAMRLATYRVPMAKDDAADGELTVFHFGAGMGGGVDANFDRWVSQFQGLDRSKALRSERTAAGLAEHVLEIESGSFAPSGMGPGAPPPTGPKSDYGLLGAIVETPGGAYFFKLIGPAKTVKAARPAFFALLDSVSL